MKYVLLLIMLTSCSSIKIKNKDQQDWIFAFKATAFKSCLLESYGEKFNVLLSNDQSVSANFEVLYVENTKIAEKVAKNFANSILTFPKDTDFEGKKNVLNSCLIFYESKLLDSIAKSEYKKLNK